MYFRERKWLGVPKGAERLAKSGQRMPLSLGDL